MIVSIDACKHHTNQSSFKIEFLNEIWKRIENWFSWSSNSLCCLNILIKNLEDFFFNDFIWSSKCLFILCKWWWQMWFKFASKELICKNIRKMSRHFVFEFIFAFIELFSIIRFKNSIDMFSYLHFLLINVIFLFSTISFVFSKFSVRFFVESITISRYLFVFLLFFVFNFFCDWLNTSFMSLLNSFDHKRFFVDECSKSRNAILFSSFDVVSLNKFSFINTTFDSW